MARRYDYSFKLILIGPVAGKSSLLRRMEGERFFGVSAPTIGVDFGISTVQISGKTVKRATGKAGNGKREREAGTGKDHRWCAKRHR